jgi:hypothetical protein
MKDGALVDWKRSVLNASKCFGISRLSVSKAEVLEGSMDGKHSVTTCTLTVNNQEIPTHALITQNDFARHDQIPIQELTRR